jgi:tetratricopeptide (TPR) repeat protein
MARRSAFHFVPGLIFLAAILSITNAAVCQAAPANDPERQRALDLYHDGKMVESMPLFEKLCVAYPNDAGVRELWGVTTLGYSQTLTDPDLRKKARARARSILVKAKELGDNSNLLKVLMEMIPEDGGDITFSASNEVNQAMQQAEGDFARGDLDKAREGYIHALLLDPNLYAAALFTGDSFFKQHIYGSAGEWFARAIQIDPNRETAYRYWGDALVSMGKMDEARTKFIDAIVAEPYLDRTWVGLRQWAEHNKVKLNWVRLQDKSAVTQKDDKNINITLDSSMGKNDPNGVAWMTYAMGRASWHGDKFKKEFPDEPKYRRTMREEADALHLMVSVLTEQKDFEKKKKDLDPALLQVVAIDRAGLIETFALLNRVDKEIALDYVAYRAANREKIYRYLDEIVVPKTPPTDASPQPAAVQ